MPVPLLLHGIPVTSSVWRPVLGPLSRLGRVLAPDLPLVTAPEAAPVDPEDWFHWLDVHVLGTVRDPVVLMVHDVGGPVGLYWAVRRPERLAGLVIMNTSVHPGATPWGSLLKVPGLVPALFALTLSPPLFRWQIRTLFGLSDEDRIAEYRAAYASRRCRRAVARAVAAWAPVLPAVAERLRLLGCPVLLLWGMRDRWIFPWKPFGECFLRDLPRARVVKLHRAGHFLQLEAPEEVAHHVADFVTACDARV